MRDRENTSQPFFTDYKLNHLELKDFVVEIKFKSLSYHTKNPPSPRRSSYD